MPTFRRTKFDSKARKCILLGYGQETKGIRLYDTAQRKVVHSRDVKFNENVKESEHSTPDVENDGKYRLVLNFTDDETRSRPDTPTEAEAPEVYINPKVSQTETSVLLERRMQHFANTHNLQGGSIYLGEFKVEKCHGRQMKSLKDNDVWDLVPLPVGSKWVYKVKTGSDGLIQRYKARLVAQGYT